MHPIPTFAIVGAGFSGMAVAVQLLQGLQSPARVCLINRSHSFGRGLAYGTNSPSHLLNVPAARMSIDPAHDSGFIDYLRSRGLSYRGADFVPRSLYGDYLERCLLKAQSAAADGVKLELLEAEVMAIQVDAQGRNPVLQFRSAGTLRATEVILALGNFTPRPPPTLTPADWNLAPLVNDVWSHALQGGAGLDAEVLLIGSGLTAYDAVLRLLDQGHRGTITMLSRRALLPQAHREQETAPAAGLVPPGFLQGEASVRWQLREVRRLIGQAAADGHDWRDVIGGLRAHTPRLWQQLDRRGRAQFVRHLMPYWDTHRHRAAPAIYTRIRAAMERGQLSVLQGRLVDVVARGPQQARVTWSARGSGTLSVCEFGEVINCTGPSSDLNRVRDPLIQHLREHGSLCVDPLALGLSVDNQYRLSGRDGRVSQCVRYVGPLLKAQHWEATAVPELRTHARNLAAQLIEASQIHDVHV